MVATISDWIAKPPEVSTPGIGPRGRPAYRVWVSARGFEFTAAKTETRDRVTRRSATDNRCVWSDIDDTQSECSRFPDSVKTFGRPDSGSVASAFSPAIPEGDVFRGRTCRRVGFGTQGVGDGEQRGLRDRGRDVEQFGDLSFLGHLHRRPYRPQSA